MAISEKRLTDNLCLSQQNTNMVHKKDRKWGNLHVRDGYFTLMVEYLLTSLAANYLTKTTQTSLP